MDGEDPPPGVCSSVCRGLCLLLMLLFFGTGTAALVLSSAPSQVFMGAVLLALGGCSGCVLVSWPVRSTRLCCVYSVAVLFCAGLLGAGCLLAERSPKHHDGLVLLALGLLGFLCVGLYAARRDARSEHRPENGPRASFLEQLSRTRLNSNSAAELCKHLFADRNFAPQRLHEADPGKMVVVCIVPGTSTVRYAERALLPSEALVYVVPDTGEGCTKDGGDDDAATDGGPSHAPLNFPRRSERPPVSET